MVLLNEMGKLTNSMLKAYDDRIAGITSIRNDTARQRSEFRAAHRQLAFEQHERLADCAKKLREDVMETLMAMNGAHHDMAASQQERLVNQRMNLAADVSGMLADFHSDLGGARSMWSEFKAVKRRHAERKSSATASNATRHMENSDRPRAIADDLTVIAGIGAGRQRQLHNMGIGTFAQLASANPERIRVALGRSGNLVHVEQWIKEAQRRK